MEKCTRCYGLSISRSVPVVLSIFLMACSQVGTIKSMGIYLEDISSSLGTTPHCELKEQRILDKLTVPTDIGVALGLFAALSYFPAPVIISLHRVKQARRGILIIGSLLISLGVILTSFATNNIAIVIYLGIAGLGHCMLTICSTLALNQIATGKRFNLLFGVGMSGFGLGMVLLPYAADILGRAYGWRGGLLILGGLMMNLIPCAMAIQPGGISKARKGMKDGLADNESDTSGTDCSISSDCPTMRQAGHQALLPNGMVDYPSDAAGESGPSEGGCSKISHNEKDCMSLMLDKASPYGSRQHQNSKKSLEGQSSNRRHTHQENESSCIRYFDRLLARFRKTDFYTDPAFYCIFGSDFMFGILYCGWHAFLVPHALQRGYSVHSTIIMTLFASVGNFLGRLFAGVLSYRLSDPIILYQCAGIVNAVAILCDVLIHHYYVMTVSACVVAITIAGMSVLGPLVVRKRSSPETFDVAYAACECFFGFGTFVGGYLSGLVGEIYSSYEATFKLLIGADMLVFLFMLPPLIFKKK